MDKYSLIINKTKWNIKDMIEYVSKLYLSDLPDGNVFELSYIKAMIGNKIYQGIDSKDIVEGVVGEWKIVPAPDEPDGVEEYFHIDHDSTVLSTSEVRGYLRKLVQEDKLDAPDVFRQKFLGMELEPPENASSNNSVESPPTEQVECKSEPDCIFKKINQGWHIKFGDSDLIGVKDLVGMSYIQLLIQSPQTPIAVRDIQAVLNSHLLKLGYDDSAAHDNQDSASTHLKSGATKNSSSMNTLYNQLQELVKRRANAERDNDLGAIELIENEVEQIQEQIDLIQYGKQDKDPELEANRKKIRKNIMDALLNIKKLEIASKNPTTPIYNHLKTHIKTGIKCRYNPPYDSSPSWIFD